MCLSRSSIEGEVSGKWSVLLNCCQLLFSFLNCIVEVLKPLECFRFIELIPSTFYYKFHFFPYYFD